MSMALTYDILGREDRTPVLMVVMVSTVVMPGYRVIVSNGQDTIYYKWASVKMTLKFHFLWSTLF